MCSEGCVRRPLRNAAARPSETLSSSSHESCEASNLPRNTLRSVGLPWSHAGTGGARGAGEAWARRGLGVRWACAGRGRGFGWRAPQPPDEELRSAAAAPLSKDALHCENVRVSIGKRLGKPASHAVHLHGPRLQLSIHAGALGRGGFAGHRPRPLGRRGIPTAPRLVGCVALSQPPRHRYGHPRVAACRRPLRRCAALAKGRRLGILLGRPLGGSAHRQRTQVLGHLCA